MPSFIDSRKHNWSLLRDGLNNLSDFFEFSLPTHATSYLSSQDFTWDESGCRSNCSWFGFKLSIKKSAPFTRTDLARYLDHHRIGNRMLFGGNLLKQPAFVQLAQSNPDSFRTIGSMAGADTIMNQSLFLGVFPGLTQPMIEHEIAVINEFVAKSVNGHL